MSTFISPEAVLSYPALFKAKLPKNAKPNDKPKFGAVVLFTHEAMKSPEFKAMQAAFVATAREKFGDKADAMIKEQAIRSPFRKDIETKGYDPKTFGCYLNVNANEEYPPQVIGRNGKPITDKAEIYPGVRARVSLAVYGYTHSGNKGVSFGLRNVQKLGDGPRIDNHKSASDEFGTLEDEQPSDENLADLLT